MAVTVVVATVIIHGWIQNQEDPMGGPGMCCDDWTLPDISNKNGMVIAGHETACGCMGGNVATYLHIRKIDDNNSRENLVFRYFQAGDTEQEVRWIGPAEVEITVNHISQIRKQIRNLNGVRIKYSIGKVDYPAW